MRVFYVKIVVLLVALTAGACSVLNHTDPEKKIRTFVADFEKSLHGADEDILNFFSTSQSNDAILAAIRVLQNKDTLNVKCSAYFNEATIINDPTGMRVLIHAKIFVDTLDVAVTDTTTVTLYIAAIKDKLVISRLGAEEFYSLYVSVKSKVAYAASEKQDHELHGFYFDKRRELQKTYDTVVWAVHYNEKSFFYVVNGTWTDNREGAYTMGLVNQDGQVIVPVEYDLIGTPGFVQENIIEVKKGGLTGYYSMAGNKLVDADYEWLVPYDEGAVFAIAKKDGHFGWISKTHEFKEGFPSKAAEKFIREYQYLTNVTISAGQMAASEIPNMDRIGAGYIMPPSYLVANNYFPEVMGDFTMESTEFRANTQSVEATFSFTESVLNKLNALVETVTERYLEGRQGFYSHQELSLLNEDGETVTYLKEGLYGELAFNTIDSTLLEIKCTSTGSSEEEYYGAGQSLDEKESNLPSYMYFQLADGGVPQQLSSNRKFPFTEFVKIDDTYLTGQFTYYDTTNQTMSTRNTLCEATLHEMRNEILASYGYIFAELEINEQFKFMKWYQPRYESIDDFRESISEIDKANLSFLEKLIGPVREPGA